jgi:cystathionine beta-lyase
VLICSDEIHSDLIYQGHKHIPIASLSDNIANQTITLISASKTFNIAGLKSSAVIITNPLLREQFQAKLCGFAGSANILGETAMRAAYQHGESWLIEFLSFLEKNRKLLVDYVNNDLPGINIHPPEGTYLGWLDCSATKLVDPAKYFLENAKVALNSGTWFGKDYPQFARINFACHQDILLSALDRIKKSLNS